MATQVVMNLPRQLARRQGDSVDLEEEDLAELDDWEKDCNMPEKRHSRWTANL
jgi:hypothetical protein